MDTELSFIKIAFFFFFFKSFLLENMASKDSNAEHFVA